MQKSVSIRWHHRIHHCVDTLVAHQLSWYRFIGRVLGKALYEGILIDVAFATFFLAKVSPHYIHPSKHADLVL